MAISNENLTDFIIDYFTGHQCEVNHHDEGTFSVQLTEQMDKVLMNRPFYWQYIKSIGLQGEPMRLKMNTNPEKKNEKGEWIHFGSPRLQQIIAHLKQTARFTKLFQEIETTSQTALFPWLVINIKISYKGKLKKDELVSLGLNLVNGIMKNDMMTLLQDASFHLHISDYCYPISPMIKIPSGFKRMEAVLDEYIEKQSHEWAAHSLSELEKEKEIIHYFYQDDLENEFLQKEIDEVTSRYTPTITYDVINGGLFYLDENYFYQKE